MSDSSAVVGFEVEWFDPVARILQTMYLKYFIDNNTLELLQNGKFFLARIYYPDVQLSDLFIGNSITVYNRRFEIKGYANSATKAFMDAREKHFLCVMSSKVVSDGLLGIFV